MVRKFNNAAPKSRGGKGAGFDPAAPGNSDSEKEEPQEPKGRGKKRKQDADGEQCAACGLGHELHQCYYAFPEKAPENLDLGLQRKSK